ncbi:MAG: ferredoxin [Candidatus Verstraetearchaeota archaeon]|nr:ferredoxin [Candidatus Verstraetearchaeota archaeon]
MKARVSVEKETCIGCGTCSSLCPDVFELSEDGQAVVKIEVVEGELADCAREAKESCPTGAISIEEVS